MATKKASKKTSGKTTKPARAKAKQSPKRGASVKAAKRAGKLPTGKGLSVLMLGTGAVAYPTTMLLREALPDIELFMAKRSWRDENIGRMARLCEHYGVKLAVHREVYDRFGDAEFHGFRYPVATTVEEAASRVSCIVDCTGQDIKAWYEDLLAARPRKSLRGIAAEGGIGEFGPQFIYGLTDTTLDLRLERRVEIPSCNTHAMSAVVWALADSGKDIDRIRQVVAFIDRRNQDIGKEGGAVQTMTFEPLVDDDFGTHQARDAYDVIIAALGGRVPPNFRMVSHATKLPQPLMHAIHFGITVEGEWTREMVHKRMEKFPLLAFTDYRAMGQVYDEFCSTSFVSRGYDYAVIIDSQTQVVPWVGQGVLLEPGGCRYSTVLMSVLVPQEGNAILSNLACAIKYLYPDDYQAIVEAVIAKKHLLTTIV